MAGSTRRHSFLHSLCYLSLSLIHSGHGVHWKPLCAGHCSRKWGGNNTAIHKADSRHFQRSAVISDACFWKQCDYSSSAKFCNSMASGSFRVLLLRDGLVFFSRLHILRCLNSFKIKIYYSLHHHRGKTFRKCFSDFDSLKSKPFVFFTREYL